MLFTTLHKIIRNRFAAALVACCLLAVLIMPLVQQVLLSPDVLYGIIDEDPEKTPDTEDHPEDLKCILFQQEHQPRLIALAPLESIYRAKLLNALCEIFIPPPKQSAA